MRTQASKPILSPHVMHEANSLHPSENRMVVVTVEGDQTKANAVRILGRAILDGRTKRWWVPLDAMISCRDVYLKNQSAKRGTGTAPADGLPSQLLYSVVTRRVVLGLTSPANVRNGRRVDSSRIGRLIRVLWNWFLVVMVLIVKQTAEDPKPQLLLSLD